MITDEKKALLEKYADQVAAFRRFCIEHGLKPAFEETHFTDLSLGFFIALGVTGDSSGEDEEFYDAAMLGIICRYDLQYWEGQSL